ncbi:hypothetical protein EFN19_04440 [Propionibacterium freudenreichii]|nr:hypothetical protein [Propionibacterium freudenreichii]MCT2978166.1 hypothetical protein [Propionibacterium freudenreichii]MCT2983873.1 hypothetical protein [Propionibacterium freudenreichii]MCT2986651.1 hypothetical protein [Propionibacterium freudenreichii]MCT2988559.1 hypothetical protein [Propionibacterium freudenreichii]
MCDREESLIDQTVAGLLIPLATVARTLQRTASPSEAADELGVGDRKLARRLGHFHPSYIPANRLFTKGSSQALCIESNGMPAARPAAG